MADSHFHLDSLLQYSGLYSLEQVGDVCKDSISELGGFVPLAVANFSWVSTFPSDDLEDFSKSSIDLKFSIQPQRGSLILFSLIGFWIC